MTDKVVVTAPISNAIVRRGEQVELRATKKIEELIAAGRLIEISRTKPEPRKKKEDE